MTKKMEKIIKQYEEKLTLPAIGYKMEILTFEEAKKELNDIYEQFDELRTAMYHYNMISEKDFLETIHTGYTLQQVAYDKLLDLKYTSTTKGE